MLTTTLYNINSVRSIQLLEVQKGLDEGSNYLKIVLEGQPKALYIYEDDQLFPYHLKNFEQLKNQLTSSWDKKEAGENANTPPLD